jgi:hypothetical protein
MKSNPLEAFYAKFGPGVGGTGPIIQPDADGHFNIFRIADLALYTGGAAAALR